MSSSPPSATRPERILWHRHWVVLLRAVFFPAAGVLSVLAAALLTRSTSSTPTRVILLVGSLVLIYRAVSLFGKAPQATQTPLSQRESVLFRVTAPVRVGMALVGYSLAGLTTATVLASFPLAAARSFVPILYGVWLFVIALWLIVNTVDWRNDVYILTHDRIIDQVRFPLLYDQRTEARLDQVQNVRYQQGFWGGLLGFGDVTVETAGRTQAVLFLQVPNPLDIQRKIFERIDLLGERRAGEQAGRQQEQLLRWFTGYHSLTGSIEVLSLPEEVAPQRPIRVEWRINIGPDREYETWIAHDTTSHATDNAYTQQARRWTGRGRKRFSDIIASRSAGHVHVKIWLRLLATPGSEYPEEVFATRELTVRVV